MTWNSLDLEMNGPDGASHEESRGTMSATGHIESSLLVSFRVLAADGTDAGWTAFVTAAAPLIHATAVRMVGEAHLAEDVTQEAFLAIHRSVARYRFPEDADSDEVRLLCLRAWIVRITSRTAINLVKQQQARRKREQVIARESARRSLADTAPESAVADPEALAVLRHAIYELPDTLREPLVLRFFEGMEFKTIAAALHVSCDVVTNRVQKALRKLRYRLDATSFGGGAVLISLEAVVNEGGSIPTAVYREAEQALAADATPVSTVKPMLEPIAWGALVASGLVVVTMVLMQAVGSDDGDPAIAAARSRVGPGPAGEADARTDGSSAWNWPEGLVLYPPFDSWYREERTWAWPRVPRTVERSRDFSVEQVIAEYVGSGREHSDSDPGRSSGVRIADDRLFIDSTPRDQPFQGLRMPCVFGSGSGGWFITGTYRRARAMLKVSIKGTGAADSMVLGLPPDFVSQAPIQVATGEPVVIGLEFLRIGHLGDLQVYECMFSHRHGDAPITRGLRSTIIIDDLSALVLGFHHRDKPSSFEVDSMRTVTYATPSGP